MEENKIPNFGLDVEKQKIDQTSITNYQFGAVDKEVLMPDGDWTSMQPECEIQKSDYVDYMDCVTESAVNIISMILQKKYGIKKNWSQRYIAKMSNTTRQGNSLYAVANAIRKYGMVEEKDYPRDRNMTWEEYYAPVSISVIKKGQAWGFDVNYETVATDKIILDKANEFAPPQVIGYAWALDGNNNWYVSNGTWCNHAFVKGTKSYPDSTKKAIDSYPTDFQIDDNSDKQEFIKILSPNFYFGDALLYSVKEIEKQTVNTSLLLKLKNMFKNLVGYMDEHGMNIFWLDKKGKQKIEITTIAEMAIYMAYLKEGVIKTSSWPALVNVPDYKYF